MKELIQEYLIEIEPQEISRRVELYFEKFNGLEIFKHSQDVVEEIKLISDLLKLDLNKCIAAAYLHDVGRMVKKEELAELCKAFGEEVSIKEEEYPSILHQKASRIIAKNVFGIEDADILDAVQCHTTLKANPSDLEIAVCLADKLSWKEEEYQNLIKEIKNGLKISKERAAFCYLDYLDKNKERLAYYHEWAQEAYEYFIKTNLGG